MADHDPLNADTAGLAAPGSGALSSGTGTAVAQRSAPAPAAADVSDAPMASVPLDDDEDLPAIVSSGGMLPATAPPRLPPAALAAATAAAAPGPRLTPHGLPVPVQGPPPPALDTLDFESDGGSPFGGGGGAARAGSGELSPGPLLAGMRAGSGGPGAAGLSHAVTMLDELLTSPSHAAAPVKVSVRDPERTEVSRMGLPVGGVLSFLVRSEADSPDLDGAKVVVEVRRRFTDFEQLHKLLRAHHSGYFFPPLPERAFFESRFTFGSDNSIRLRRVDLQAYMRALAAHPQLRSCEELRLFLSQPGDLAACPRWQQLGERPAAGAAIASLLSNLGLGDGGGGGAPQQQQAEPAAGGGGGVPGGLAFGLLRMKNSMKQGLATTLNVVGAAPAPVRPRGRGEAARGPEEQELRQAKEMLRELMAHLSVASGAARALVSHTEAVTEDLAALGKALGGMARFEEDCSSRVGQYTTRGATAAQRAADLQAAGTTAHHAASAARSGALRTSAALVFLHDYNVLMPEAISALEERESALEVVEVLQEELEDKEAALARAQAAAAGGQPGADRKAAALAGAVGQLQDRMASAVSHYETLKARNFSELERIGMQSAEDFRAALRRFAREQAAAAAAVAEVWLAAAGGGGGSGGGEAAAAGEAQQ